MQNKTNPTSRGVFIATIVLGVMILIPSMIGFFNKLYEFTNIIRGEADGAFALTPILNYTLASLGFFCLLIWASFHGMFRDIEEPKFTMLDRESDLDKEEVNYIPKWAGGPEKS